MDTPLCTEAGSAASCILQAVRCSCETPAGHVFTSESNEACKKFKLSMKCRPRSEKLISFFILFGIHVIFLPSIFAIESNRRYASYPLRLWKTTRMGSCSRLIRKFMLQALCAAPRYFPAKWQWSFTASPSFLTTSGYKQCNQSSWLLFSHLSTSSSGCVLFLGLMNFSL